MLYLYLSSFYKEISNFKLTYQEIFPNTQAKSYAVFQKIENGVIPISFYGVRITLIQKPEKDIVRNVIYTPISS